MKSNKIRSAGVVLLIAAVMCISACSRQQSDWEKARGVNTIDSYEQFLKKYPSGEFSAQAEARVKELYEERDWQKARDADTSVAYQEFLKQYPEGKWAEEARIRVENFSLAQTPAGTPTAEDNASAAAGPQAGPTPAKPATAAKPALPAKPPAAAAKPAVPVKSAPAVASADKHRIQLGAFAAGAAAAKKHWADLKQQNATLLKGLDSHVSPLKTPKGEVYRLQVGGLSSDRAHSICAALKAKSQACAVVD